MKWALRGGLLAGLAMLLWCGSQNIDSGPAVTTASIYSDTVNSYFINKSWLRLVPPETMGWPADSPWRLHLRIPDGPDQESAVKFAEDSELLRDIVRANDPVTPEDSQIFEFHGYQVSRIDPHAHQYRLPHQTERGWRGRLLLSARETDDLRMRSGERNLVLNPLSSKADDQVDPVDIPLFSPPRPCDSLQGERLMFSYQGSPVAVLWRMGDGAVLRLKPAASRIGIRINGRLLQPAGGDVNGGLFALPHGGVLLFEEQSGGGRRETWEPDATQSNVIYDARTDLWDAAYDQPYFHSVVSALKEVAWRTGTVIDADVKLTLSPVLGSDTRQVLRKMIGDDSASAQSCVSPKQVLDKGAPVPKDAILLMDSKSGAILAAPSFPEAVDLEEDHSDSKTNTLLENHNFERQAIGSAAKPLFFSAIFSVDKDLMSLRIPLYTSCGFDNIVGIPFVKRDKGINDDCLAESDVPSSAHGLIDLDTALRLSLNRYAATVLTLATRSDEATRPGGSIQNCNSFKARWTGDCYELNGTVMRQRRPGLVFEPGTEGTPALENQKWAVKLASLYDIDTVGSSPDRSARTYVWEDLPSEFVGVDVSDSPLRWVSPERESLKLHRISDVEQQFDTDFLSLILGGGESRWSNVELAEAYSSLVLNHRVKARLVASASDEAPCKGDSAARVSLLDADVHNRLLEALAGVINGTAKGVRENVSRLATKADKAGYELLFFSKTGTPKLASDHLEKLRDTFDRMAAEGVFTADSQGNVLYRGDVVTLKSAEENAYSPTRPGPASRDFRRHFIEGMKLSTERALDLWQSLFVEIAEHNRTAPAYRGDRFQIRGGSLLAQFTGLQTSRNSGKTFVFVAALRRKDEQSAVEMVSCNTVLRAITGVVTFADPTITHGGKTEDLAVKTAARLFDPDGPVARYLFSNTDDASSYH